MRWAASLVAPAILCVRMLTPRSNYAFLPGDASPANKRVVTGSLERHRSKGTILFVTIGLQSLTQLTLDLAEHEPSVDLYTREQILGKKSPSEARKEDLQLMRYSRDFAAYVALKRLGYDVHLTDAGAVIKSVCMKQDAGGACSLESPAAKVLKVNDIITNVDGHDVQVPSDVAAALKDRTAGDTIPVTVKRGAESVTVDVPLTTSTDGTRTVVGFVASPAPPQTAKFQLPQGVRIDSGDVGGPSAGLAFTLALLDELTPGELTGGAKIAVTGEIELDGGVGEIGGLRQKTIAVRRAGATAFLVPAGQVAEAQKAAEGSNLKVIGVTTLEEALHALTTLGGNGDALATK